MVHSQSGLALLLFLFEIECPWRVHSSTGTTMSPFEDCTSYPTLANAIAFTGVLTHDSVVNVDCSNGFINTGAEQFICNNGEWQPAGNGGDPYCAIQCEVPPFENGQVDPINNGCMYESCVVQFTCDTGYTLSGSQLLTCRPSGSFGNGNLPTCQIVDCGPPSLTNGQFTGSTTYQSTVTFTCNDQYTLSGSGTAICGLDGTWSELPSCIYNCGQFTTIANANQVASCNGEQLPGCTVTVSCNSGYTLQGNRIVRCIADQGWSPEPYCRLRNERVAPDIILIFPLPPQTDQTNLQGIMILQLTTYYQRKMGSDFITIVIINISFITGGNGRKRRQADAGDETLAVVTYSVITGDSATEQGQFAEAHADLVATETLEIDGHVVEPIETTVFGETFTRDATGNEDISCQIFKLDNGVCPSGTECAVTEVNGDASATCESSEKDDDLALELGLGVGIPLFLLTCGLIVAAAYFAYVLGSRRRRHRRRKQVEPDDSDSASASGFTPTRVPTRFNPGGRTGPVYGSYFPEAWNEVASIDDEDLRDTYNEHDIHRQPSYLVSLGHTGHSHGPSNYSWDFLYPKVDKEFAMPRPRI